MSRLKTILEDVWWHIIMLAIGIQFKKEINPENQPAFYEQVQKILTKGISNKVGYLYMFCLGMR
jgi:hypothetical protein